MNAYIAPTYPDMSRWHDPANDCPNRAAFLDALLGRKAAAAPEPSPEPEQPRCKACGKVIQELVTSKKARRFDVQYCDQACRKRHTYAVKGGLKGGRATAKHSGQCRKCGTPRPAGATCPRCRAENKRKSNAKQRAKAHPAILPSDADAVGVRA